MSNIRVDVDYTIKDGTEIKLRSPVDCSQITGLIVYYPGSDGNTISKVFALSDAHGNNVGNIDHLFAEDVVVKVILDVTKGMAFVQNADTNAYLESHIQSKENPHGVTPAQIGAVSKTGDIMSGDLHVQKGIPAVRLDSGTGTAALFKNAAGTNDFGTTLEDVRTDGRKVSLSLNADQSGAEALTLYSSADNASYKVLHTGNKNYITPADIGAVAITKLWENASPTSSFNQQHISIDLSGYSHVAINFSFDKNFSRLSGWYIFAKNTPIYGRVSEIFDQYGIARDVMYVLDSGVSFAQNVQSNLSDGIYAEGYGTQMIPFQIYGIKGVL